MILEIAMLNVVPGRTESFEASFREASAIIASIRGYVRHELQRCTLWFAHRRRHHVESDAEGRRWCSACMAIFPETKALTFRMSKRGRKPGRMSSESTRIDMVSCMICQKTSSTSRFMRLPGK